jgi:GDPmannose 4,6-dehydratase
MKTALITGFPGQDACYLASLLLDKGYTVYGTVKRYTCPDYSNMEYLDLFNKGLKLITCDITDIGSIFEALEESKPDEFYNLAAQSFVGSSWQLKHNTTQVNAVGPMNCLEAIKQFNPNIKFYQAGTSEMFGNANIDGKQTENTPFMPRSPYGIAKLFSYHITKNFRESYGMFACTGILFNHESPIRGVEFVTRKITIGVARIAKGNVNKIVLGNLDAERDWGFAGDYVSAQWMMLQQDTPKDYIIASGRKHSVADVCQLAFARIGINDWRNHVEVSNDFVRPAEVDSLVADPSRAMIEMGWQPTMIFEDLINLMVDEDIKRLTNS